MDYTLGAETRQDPYHIPIVRTTLTRALGVRFPDIKDETIAAFNDIIPLNDCKGEYENRRNLSLISRTDSAWKSYHASSTVMQIVARTSNRLFVGLPLCEFLENKFCYDRET